MPGPTGTPRTRSFEGMPVDALAAGPLPSPDEAGAAPLAAEDGAGPLADPASPDEAHGSESELRRLRPTASTPAPPRLDPAAADRRDPGQRPGSPPARREPDAPATVAPYGAVIVREPDAPSPSGGRGRGGRRPRVPCPAEIVLSAGPVPGFASASFGLSLPLPVPPQAAGEAPAADAPDVIPLRRPEPLLALTYAPAPRVPEVLWPTAAVHRRRADRGREPAPAGPRRRCHLPSPVAGFDLSPLECFVPGDDFVLPTEGFALPPLGWPASLRTTGQPSGRRPDPGRRSRRSRPPALRLRADRPRRRSRAGPNASPRPPRIILPVAQAQPVPVGQAQPVPVEPVQPVPAEQADSRLDETAYPVPSVPSLAEEPAWLPADDARPSRPRRCRPSPLRRGRREPGADDRRVRLRHRSRPRPRRPEDDDDIWRRCPPRPLPAPAAVRAPDAPYALRPDAARRAAAVGRQRARHRPPGAQRGRPAAGDPGFRVRGEILAVRPGPVVTLYEMEPAPGTKSSRVLSSPTTSPARCRRLRPRRRRPGRNAIGIELPNAKRETVYLRELLASPVFAETKQKLACVWARTSAASRSSPISPHAPPARRRHTGSASRWRSTP